MLAMTNAAIQSGSNASDVASRYQPAANEGQTHTVERGDTLSEIAEKNGVSLSALIAANPQIKNPDLIYPGEKIRIPESGGAETAAPGDMGSTARSELTTNDQARAAQVRSAAAGSSGGNDILSSISTDGASARTARQDGLSGGVSSSKTMANTDASRVLKYKDAFNAAGAKYGVPPALLAAIASRESRGGAALDRNGRGDGGNGYGLMQVDVGTRPNPKGGPYSAEHIDEAASILKEKLDTVKAQYPNASAADQLKLATAKYNGGSGTISNPDKGTTGGDYSNDVIARAQTYAANWGGVSTTPPGSTGGGTPSAGGVPAAGLAKGSGVQSLQNQLVKLGHASAADMATGPGTFGPRTEAAVKSFQAANGLAQTGKFDETTRTAMVNINSGIKRGDSGKQVEALQDKLVAGGFMTSAQVNTGRGTFGPQTEAALKAFQKANNISQTGQLGPTTYAALQKGSAASGAGNDASSGGSTNGIPTLRQGDAASAKVRSVGCGITSATMAINGLTGKNMTPDQFYNKHGFYLTGGMQAAGLKVTEMSDLHSGNMNTQDKAWDVFKNATSSGKVVMFAANGQPFTSGSYGHIMLATATSSANGESKLTFNDPATGTSRTVDFSTLWNARSHTEGNFVRVISK
jgi:spore coat assembly protein SafA